MRLDVLKWNDYTFKQLSKEAKLIYCFLEAHCSTAGFIQADESDIANGIGLERRLGLNPFSNVVILTMKELEDTGFIVKGDHDFILVKGTHKKRAHGKLKVSDKAKDYYRVGNKYKIGFNPCTKHFTKHPFPYLLCNFVRNKLHEIRHH